MKIENFKVVPLKEGRFIHPKLAKFKMDNQERDWEIIQSSDSVAILIYHKQKDAFIFVRQFRPAVYAKNRDGMTLELCAGLVDKDKSLAQIAAEEVEEECGYRVDASLLQKVSSFLLRISTVKPSIALCFFSKTKLGIITSCGVNPPCENP